MSKPLDIKDFLAKSLELPVIDVRTPAEYAQGHIPRAVNLPLFTNEERALVGTLYVQQGRRDAVLKGLELVGPRLEAMARAGLDLSDRELLVHCWRGGMRSGAVAWLLEQTGIRCFTLEKGYQAYRSLVLDFFNHIPHRIIILGGLTGSGKTERLLQMRAAGEQVIDLEGLANHKGSAFGWLGMPPQPSTEHFENMLFHEFSQLDPLRPVWLEDESRNVGKCSIPSGLWKRMEQAEFHVLETPTEIRIERLMQEYACFPPSLLCESVLRIEKRLGYDKCYQALDACQNGDIRKALGICLAYYDKSYTFQIETRLKSNKQQ